MARKVAKLPAEDPLTMMETYHRMVPADVRADIRSTLMTSSKKGTDAFLETCKYLLGRIFAGDLPPAVAQAAVPYVEMLQETYEKQQAALEKRNTNLETGQSTLGARVAQATARADAKKDVPLLPEHPAFADMKPAREKETIHVTPRLDSSES